MTHAVGLTGGKCSYCFILDVLVSFPQTLQSRSKWVTTAKHNAILLLGTNCSGPDSINKPVFENACLHFQLLTQLHLFPHYQFFSVATPAVSLLAVVPLQTTPSLHMLCFLLYTLLFAAQFSQSYSVVVSYVCGFSLLTTYIRRVCITPWLG